MIYDSNPKDQLSQCLDALRTVQYALMSDGGGEDAFDPTPLFSGRCKMTQTSAPE